MIACLAVPHDELLAGVSELLKISVNVVANHSFPEQKDLFLFDQIFFFQALRIRVADSDVYPGSAFFLSWIQDLSPVPTRTKKEDEENFISCLIFFVAKNFTKIITFFDRYRKRFESTNKEYIRQYVLTPLGCYYGHRLDPRSVKKLSRIRIQGSKKHWIRIRKKHC